MGCCELRSRPCHFLWITKVNLPLFIFYHPPLQNLKAREGVEALLACAAFDQRPKVMFIDQGVLQLIPQNDNPGLKNLNKMVQALEIYGVESIFICRTSVARFGLSPDELKPQGQLIAQHERSAIIQHARWVVNF
jgi:tRNA 2-thiouridine synthesizing protein C